MADGQDDATCLRLLLNNPHADVPATLPPWLSSYLGIFVRGVVKKGCFEVVIDAV
jgi:hypothetical protein